MKRKLPKGFFLEIQCSSAINPQGTNYAVIQCSASIELQLQWKTNTFSLMSTISLYIK